MAIAFKQAAHTMPAANVSSTTIVATYAGAVTPGSLLVAWIVSDQAGGATSVVDSVNGAWTAATNNTAWVLRGDIYYFANTGAGTPAVTVTWGAAASNRSLYIAEYSGLATTLPNDKNASNGTAVATTTPATAATPVPTANGELFFAGLYVPSNTVTITAGTNLTFTKRDSGQDTFSNSAAIQDAVQVTAASKAADWSMDQSLAYVTCVSTFMVPAAPAGSGATNVGGTLASRFNSPLFYGNFTST